MTTMVVVIIIITIAECETRTKYSILTVLQTDFRHSDTTTQHSIFLMIFNLDRNSSHVSQGIFHSVSSSNSLSFASKHRNHRENQDTILRTRHENGIDTDYVVAATSTSYVMRFCYLQSLSQRSISFAARCKITSFIIMKPTLIASIVVYIMGSILQPLHQSHVWFIPEICIFSRFSVLGGRY